MKVFKLILLQIIISSTLTGQNRSEFFKSVPFIDQNTPEWAKLMYSKNPNVAEVEKLYRAYYKENSFSKTLHTQNHKHWIRIVEPLLDEKGYIVPLSRTEEDALYQKLKNKYHSRSSSIPGADTGWVTIGPFETFHQSTSQPISWHKNIYSIDQSISNPNLLICGTEGGGVYKSTDKSQNWTLISKGEVFSGSNSAVKIHPTNQDNYLLASNSRIYQSLDGGLSWIERKFTGGTGNEFKYLPSNNNTIFHTSSSGLFKSTDGGVNWTQHETDICWDIDFHPTNSTIVYLLKSNSAAKRSELYRSNDSGNTWTLKDNGWYIPSNTSTSIENGGKIAVTAAAPNIVYVCLIGSSKTNDDGWIGVYKSSNNGDSWTNPAGQDGGPYVAANAPGVWNVAAYSSGYHQGYYNFDMEASPLDSNKLWVGTIRLSESTDGGQSFQSIGGAESTRLDYIHADIQDIEVNGTEVWVASDGGINFSSNSLMTHSALNKGIHAADFWGFNTGWNEDSYTGGKYHDGTSGWSENYGIGNSYNIGGVEEASGYIHPIESRKMMFRVHYASNNTSVKTIPINFGGQVINHSELPIRPNESYYTAERSGVYFNPIYANHMYVGLDNKIYKSTNGGSSFRNIYTFPDAAGMVYEIEISRSNPDTMYAVYNKTGGYWDPCEIWKSTDAGNTWSISGTNPSGNRSRFRISIHPEDANKLWVCTARGTNGHKVHYSSDGAATWTNITTPTLDGENLVDILYQGGSNGVVYVASQNAVFYTDNSSSGWTDYSLGLPLIPKSLQINPFYRDGELRLASKGRGVWARAMQDTSFYPIAQPITYSDSVYCAKDTVQFDCYSILKHAGASWNWNISPTPQFISSTSTRNPQVVFGTAGNYNVSLTVTDALGNTSTKSIAEMIKVENLCTVDTVPGLAISLQTTQSYVNIPDLKMDQITSMTMSAWIKPDGLQENWTGIIMNDNDAAGINFYDACWCPSLQLGYHWPGGSWSWGSGLFVNDGEWSHVAIVATTSSVTIYLNGVASTHTVNLSPVDINSMKIGSYQGWGSRNFKGEIDEVCIWDRALSRDEIRELRHLTRSGPNAYNNGLAAYYQFNLSSENTILDKVGTNHADLSGGAVKSKSTAPVGGGSSDRQTISTSGNYSFANTETEIDFGTVTPNNEIVVSRINLAPDSMLSTNPYVNNYWIINNYGSNFTALNKLQLKSSSGIPVGNSADARLYTREENGHINNWINNCAAANYTNNSYHYTTSCNITYGQQFFIQSQNSNNININYLVENSNQTICSNEQILLGGSMQNSPGIYYDTFNISNGVDSVIITNLIVNSVDTVVNLISGTLTANSSGAVYQWLDCNSNFSAILGATNQSFTPLSNGNYALAITENGCTDTSVCITVIALGATDNSFGHQLIYYPNPNKGNLTIDLGIEYPEISVKIYAINGQLINSKAFSNSQQLELNIETVPGTYIVELTDGKSKKAVLKIIRE